MVRAAGNARRKPRSYNGVMQNFHNFEHSRNGRNHCKSNGNTPYRIEHVSRRHKISGSVATGHGRGGRPQKFRFTRRLGNGWDMSSGVRI